MRDVLLKIASFFYGAAIKLRHLLFDIGILRSERFDIPIICVGNITVGGTGKTPAVEMLVEHYSETYHVAVLSRGYGRITKGYREVKTTDNYREVGDEPLQIKLKFPNVRVVVCEKRAFAVRRIQEEFPEVNMIIMDDGFQHRYVDPLVNIIIVDYNRPVERDHLLPYGQLRDTISSLYRAHYFIVTKCPETMKPIDMREKRMWLIEKPSQEIYFSRMQRSEPCSVFAGVKSTVTLGAPVIAMSGLGDNDAFNRDLKQRYRVVATMDLEDHHSYRMSDLKRMIHLLERHPGAVIMTTEKDAVKLANSEAVTADLRSKIFYEKITMCFVGNSRMELFDNIDNDIKNRDNEKHIKGLSGNSGGYK
ncbi:MAG: tetraacyldisaccharide 4'-kinase [Alistipes sp.]|nr:tetraacyldisaccharide 4'-kinase [Alistipes sp.]